MKRWTWGVVLCAGWMAMAAGWPLAGRAQEQKPASEVGARCNLKVFGEKDTKRFLNFDGDLRAAIQGRDTARLAALVLFPLRVNDDRGSIFIHDARSLDGEFDRIFPEAIRKAILSSTRDSIWCNYSGIAYGEDRVWVNVTDKGFFLWSVNLPERKGTPGKNTAELACHTDTLRVAIDRAKDDTVRYRAWKLDESLNDRPVIEIEKGKGSIEGTGPCSHLEWSFATATGTMLVMEPGCVEAAPPDGAQAEIVITAMGGKETSSWCF
jgi:hypothetical protein